MTTRDSNLHKGLLVVSFGTAHAPECEKTIGAIERDLIAAFPDRKFCRAFTSRVIRRKIEKEQGIIIPDVAEALVKMAANGITDLLIQPTHMLNGKENRSMLETISAQADLFKTTRVGNPLLTDSADLDEIAYCIPGLFPEVGPADPVRERGFEEVPFPNGLIKTLSRNGRRPESLSMEGSPQNIMLHNKQNKPEDLLTNHSSKDILLLMGHGSPDGDNSVYTAINERLAKAGHGNIMIALLEAHPTLSDLLPNIQKMAPNRIFLSLFMVVAGRHARHDLTGMNPNAWQQVLYDFEAVPILKGIGEYPEIRKIYVRHAMEARVIPFVPA